ncbi:RND transporter [Desulfurivibrio sp. D14AmB]|uniref:RND transporter n=1 Tax=Desulfurivibrio sp. D14AmB TaxID=3374370 RepID=UPI00376EAD01
MFAWLDGIPLALLVIAALLVGLAPFYPEPHLVEKLRLLAQGELKRPLDIFDLLMHAAPAVLLLIRLARMGLQRLS